MLRTCGLHSGKSCTEIFLGLYHSLSPLHDLGLSHFLHLSFLLSYWGGNPFLTGCRVDENSCSKGLLRNENLDATLPFTGCLGLCWRVLA